MFVKKTKRQPVRIKQRRLKKRPATFQRLEARCLLASHPFVPATDNADVGAFVAEDLPQENFFIPSHVFSSGVTEPLTGPSALAPVGHAVAYLRAHASDFGLQASDFDNFRVTDEYTSRHTGVTHVYLRQLHRGLEVIHAEASVSITADGRVLAASSSFLPNLNASLAVPRSAASSNFEPTPQLDPAQAMAALADHFGWAVDIPPPVRNVRSWWRLPAATLRQDAAATDISNRRRHNTQEQYIGSMAGESADAEPSVPAVGQNSNQATILPASGISLEPIPAHLRYVPVSKGGVELAWALEVQTVDRRHWYDASVSALTGNMLYVTDWGSDASYNVYPQPLESPADGTRSIQTDAPDTEASPLGWHDTDPEAGVGEFNDTRGNNVRAQEDRDADDLGGFRPDGGDTQEFDFPIDFESRPSANQDAAITNLFYQSNVLHDIHLLYGFDEAAGNFQETNFSGLGSGGDAVRADAQDGFEIDNAAFFAPPDGNVPRIQMAEWRGRSALAVDAPASLVGEFSSGSAQFGPPLSDAGTTGDVRVSQPLDGCTPLTNSSEIAGKIALIERGTCFFVEKVLHAQDAGAIGVVVTNNEPDGIVSMAGTDPAITIPSLLIGLDDGNLLRAEITAGEAVVTTLTGSPNRDSSFDNGIIIHEYGHGVSSRLTGGPANSRSLDAIQSGAMGEGWSDWWALMLTQNANDTQMGAFPIGTYVLSQAADGEGLRRFPYSYDMTVNPLTYADFDESQADVPCPAGCSEVHNGGEIWASALWDLNWLLINGDGMRIPAQGFDADLYRGTGGNNVALQLVLDALKLQPSNPTFVEGRDALLAADLALTGGANQLAIWTTFSRRGIGFSADDGGSANSVLVTEAFDLPPFLVSGDFNGDLAFGCHDIGLLGAGIVAGANDPQLDVTGDGLVDLSDRDAWLGLAGAVNLPSGSAHPLGDANLDGRVDSQDLNALALNWQAETRSWCGGDFNADGVVGSADLNLLGINWQVDVAAPPVMAAPALPAEAAMGRQQRDAMKAVAEDKGAAAETTKPVSVRFAVQRRFLQPLARRRLASANSPVPRGWADRIDDVMGDWQF